jgi:ATP-dependent Clp protease ATP-binding subunit ClpA
MQHNPEIESIIENSVKIARQLRHQYVLTEHVLMSLLQHTPFRRTLEKFGTDVNLLEADVGAYLGSLQSLVSDDADVQPKKTNALERTFNRALTQVLFTGRRSITTIDLYLALMAETNSHTHYFLLKHGVTKTEFVEFWNTNYLQGTAEMTDKQATEILSEYCTNLTQQAQKNELEPLIGRSKELEEMIAVLARRFKANVLMVGDPGVGKTCIVEGLAQEIAAGRVPEFLKDH